MIYSCTLFKNKQYFFLLFLLGFFIVFILSGCPYRSVYSIDTDPQLHINESYLGTWETTTVDANAKPIKVILTLTKNTDSIYNIEFSGYFGRLNKKKKPVIDTIFGTSYLSNIGSREFMNIKVRKLVFVAQVLYKNDELSLLAMTENFTNKMVKCDEQLRNALAYHFRTRLNPLYDDDFCLKNMKRVSDKK
jgi:hypothetical protein